MKFKERIPCHRLVSLEVENILFSHLNYNTNLQHTNLFQKNLLVSLKNLKLQRLKYRC